MPENFLAGGTPPANGGGRGRQGQQPKEESFNALGLQVKELTDSNAKELGYQDKVSGVLVSGVDPNGPAAQAGISAGQVIEKVGGKKIASLKEFEEALKAASLKDGVTLLVSSPTGKYFVVVQSDTTK
jgi:serine protease Do